MNTPIEADEDYQFPSPESSRNAFQKVALFGIYNVLTYVDMGQPVNVEDIVSSLCGRPYPECDYFVKAAVVYSARDMGKAVEILNAHMRHWTFDRLNRVEQAILLLAYVHFYDIGDIDKAAVISIAIRQAKTYLEDQDYKFVNAILDHVLQAPKDEDK